MIEILTPYDKWHRVNRNIDIENFLIDAGKFAVLKAANTLANVTTDTAELGNKLCITSVTDSVYESHASSTGKMTNCEDPGVRVKIDSTLYIGTIAITNTLGVANDTGNEGKVFAIADAGAGQADGTYQVVGIVEEVGTDYIIYRLTNGDTTAVIAA